MTKEPKICNGERTVSSLNGARKTGQPNPKSETGPQSSYTKTQNE